MTFSIGVSFDVAGDMTATERDCISTAPNGTGTLNTATVTVRGVPLSDSACGVIPDPDIAIVKTVTNGPTRDANGVWTITYDLQVTNGANAGPGFYVLDDVLQFGGGVTVLTVTPSAITPGLTVNPAFNGGSDTFVADDSIDAGGLHLYRVTVTATVAVGDPGDGDCDPASSGPGTGFLNTAKIVVQGTTTESKVCRPYSTLTLVKNLINDDGGNAILSQFVLSAKAGADPAIIDGPDPDAALDSGIGTGVPGGDYTLAETTVTGYVASTWVCTGGPVVNGVVTVSDGSDVVCVITNDDKPVDLQLTKSDGGAVAVAGGPSFDYTLTIDNVGTRDADLGEPVVVTDELPAGLVYVSFPSNCTAAGQRLTCSIDPADMQVADPAIVLTITVKLAADAPSGTYINKAFVTTADDPACQGPELRARVPGSGRAGQAGEQHRLRGDPGRPGGHDRGDQDRQRLGRCASRRLLLLRDRRHQQRSVDGHQGDARRRSAGRCRLRERGRHRLDL